MWGTGSSRIDRLLVLCWIGSAAVNIVLMYLLPGAETVPFHLVWIGLAVIYGLTPWRAVGMSVVLLVIAALTGFIMVHHAATGEIAWEETTEVPLMSALFVVMVWHVHRRQQALDDLARLSANERRRSEVQRLSLRLASHELRTPITIARGYTEMIRRALADPKVRDDVAIVLDELDKLARITQRLVTVMQLDGRQTALEVDIDAELTRIVRRWAPTAPRAWSVHSTVGSVAIDLERLETALDCVLENAVKFTRAGDRIEIVGGAGPDYWTVEVVDSGVGMTAERAAALTATRAPLPPTASGTGLGLAIVRAVMTPWGGAVAVSSQPDRGTKVTLRIPRPAAKPAAVDVRPAAFEPAAVTL